MSTVIYEEIDTEDPKRHWKHVNVNNRRVLDLGCGRHRALDIKRSSGNPSQWLDTPDHFVTLGASDYLGIDNRQVEIDFFSKRFCNVDSVEFKCINITSTEDIIALIQEFAPDCIKCDIAPGQERYLLAVPHNIFSLVQEYYVEAHSKRLTSECIVKFEECGFVIPNAIQLTHCNMKVLFAVNGIQEVVVGNDDPKVVLVDVDDTICYYPTARKYNLAMPIQHNIDKINKLHAQGWTVIYWTSRGQGKTEKDSRVDFDAFTHAQLKDWGCKFDDLITGASDTHAKTHFDMVIDDKAKRIEEL